MEEPSQTKLHDATSLKIEGRSATECEQCDGKQKQKQLENGKNVNRIVSNCARQVDW